MYYHQGDGAFPMPGAGAYGYGPSQGAYIPYPGMMPPQFATIPVASAVMPMSLNSRGHYIAHIPQVMHHGYSMGSAGEADGEQASPVWEKGNWNDNGEIANQEHHEFHPNMYGDDPTPVQAYAMNSPVQKRGTTERPKGE